MRIVVLHNAVSEGDSLEDQDVLVQAAVVSRALRQLGHEPTEVACTLNLAALRDRLAQLRPDLVFNLVESLDGVDALSYLPPALLDAMDLPYTGNPTEATFLTTHKLLAKGQLRQAGLPTPQWIAIGAGDTGPCATASQKQCWIIKGVWEQASRNLDDDAIVTDVDEPALRVRLQDWAARVGRPCYAEQFISGREFNLAMLAGPEGPEVLPPAEIDFSAFPPGKPRIVGYRAKWHAESFEFQNTPRRFLFDPSQQPLLDRLRALSLECWALFSLRGYVRVDFRVGQSGQPWILEINTNPCLSPDAGFAAALEQASIPFERAVERIIDDATVPSSRRL